MSNTKYKVVDSVEYDAVEDVKVEASSSIAKMRILSMKEINAEIAFHKGEVVKLEAELVDVEKEAKKGVIKSS